MSFEFEIEREKDGLHIGKNRAKDEEPHLDKVGYEALVRDLTESLFE